VSVSNNDTSNNRWLLTGSWAGAWKVCAGLGVLGAIGAVVGLQGDSRRFAFSWLFAFITVLTVALGALFFVLVQHLTSAGWSVTVRRVAEVFACGVVVMIPLFFPVAASMNQLFPWMSDHSAHDEGHPHDQHGAAREHSEQPGQPEHRGALEIITPAYAQEHAPAGPPGHVVPPLHGEAGAAANHMSSHAAHAGLPDPHAIEHAELMEKKSAYLNRSRFGIFAAIYFAIWTWLALRFFRHSTLQDTTKDPKLTLKSQGFAPAATFLFALSITFAGVDWIMSLEPTWFSTIFGVYIFGGSVVSSYALLILVTLGLRSSGPLSGAVTIEHFHDLGKLMFGFLVFWAYIGFSQFMLIWYAALPEETTFFHNRWGHAPWATVSIGLVVGHFVVPFFWTISRNFKRNLNLLYVGALIILVMHVVDIYWLVMPNFRLGQDGFAFHWLDVACLLAVGGTYGTFVFLLMKRHSLVPVGDPRLERSLHFQNA